MSLPCYGQFTAGCNTEKIGYLGAHRMQSRQRAGRAPVAISERGTSGARGRAPAEDAQQIKQMYGEDVSEAGGRAGGTQGPFQSDNGAGPRDRPPTRRRSDKTQRSLIEI